MKALGTVVVASLLFVSSAARALARDASADVRELTLREQAMARPLPTLPRTPLDLAFEYWLERARPATADDLLFEMSLRKLEHKLDTPAPRQRERIVLDIAAPRFAGLEDRQALVGQLLDELPLPLLGRAWAVASGLVPAEVDGLARDMTVELGGDSLRTPTPNFLRDFAGTLAHGPYSRADDANGTAIAIDVRVVLAWRPDDRIRLEAGYAVAYAGGEYGAQLDGVQSGGHRSDFLRHGPWAAVGVEF